MMNKDEDLKKNLRNGIDSIDNQLISLFVERLNISLKIGLDKLGNGIVLHDKEREAALISRLEDMSQNKLPKGYIKSVYTQILQETRNHIVNVYNEQNKR